MEKLDIIIVIFAILLSIVLLAAGFGGGVLETGSWGLSFQIAGQPPSGPASAEALAQFDGVYLGSTEEKVIYLTFDAGYENGYTAQILDALKKHNAPATFFLVGN